MGTGFDFTRLDDDFFLAAPDFSANAKLAASADLLPSGDYRFHILGSRFLGDRRCGHLGFDLIVCDGTFAGSHTDLSFYIYHPLTRIRRRACERIRCLQLVCGLGGAPLENAAMFHGREFTGSVWNYRFEGLPASKIVRFYYPDGTWPGMEAVCGNGGNAGSGQSGMPDSAPGEEAPVSRPGCGSESGDSGSAEENPYLREGGDWRDDDGGADVYSTGSASPAGTCGSASRLRFGKEARA